MSFRSDICRDCGQQISFQSAQHDRVLAMNAGGAQPITPRRIAHSRQRCETCSIARSNTNILFCGLMLAALLSFLWYQDLTRADEGSWGAPLVVFSNFMHASPAPPARAPAPARPLVVVARPRAIPAEVARPSKSASPVIRARHHATWRPPPHDVDGLY
jgi:hypothetical protein